MKYVQALFAVIVFWVLATLTVYLLKDWGPIEAIFKYTGQGAYIAAGGIFAVFIIVFLLLVYAFLKLIGQKGIAGTFRSAFRSVTGF
ncbi:MAG TPA: hypothetical protein VJK02_22670 [Anaerolineales bacterium]|nr:hypothetical protein [Anaerolineales bacterium]